MMVIKNAAIYDFDHYQRDCFIVHDELVRHVGYMADFKEEDYPQETIIDASDCLLMPSLVVGHTHIYAALSRGLSLPFDPKDFRELLEQLWWRIDGALDREAVYLSGVVSGIEYVKNGVTTIIDHHASGRMITGSLETLKRAVVDTVGLRGIFCFETSNRFSVEECIQENISFIEHNKSQTAAGLFGAHALLTLKDEDLSALKQAAGNYPIHIHAAESLQDQEECERNYGQRVIERLEHFGLLNEDSILSHLVHINDQERSLIKNRGCVAAINVTSNMNNGVGLTDIMKLREAEIPMIIGNDGMSASIMNEWAQILFVMHHFYQSPSGFSLSILKEMIDATYAYASRRLRIKLGRVREGYAADLMIVPYISPTMIDSANALSHLIYGLATSFKPRDVSCRGHWIVRDYEVSHRLKEAYKQAEPISAQLWEWIKKEGK